MYNFTDGSICGTTPVPALLVALEQPPTQQSSDLIPRQNLPRAVAPPLRHAESVRVGVVGEDVGGGGGLGGLEGEVERGGALLGVGEVHGGELGVGVPLLRHHHQLVRGEPRSRPGLLTRRAGFVMTGDLQKRFKRRFVCYDLTIQKNLDSKVTVLKWRLFT